MIHQRIAVGFADPDLANAVTDFRDSVIEIRRRSARAIALRPDSREAGDERAQIESLVADIEARADRIGISIDDLFRAINADLATSRADVAQPHGALQRALLDENTRAYAEEASAHAALTRAQARVAEAGASRLAADRACAGYVAGWALRGAR